MNKREKAREIKERKQERESKTNTAACSSGGATASSH
jgi:hypothetical protein